MIAIRAYLAAVRALIDALVAESGSGLVPHHALPMIVVVDRLTRAMERQPDPPEDAA